MDKKTASVAGAGTGAVVGLIVGGPAGAGLGTAIGHTVGRRFGSAPAAKGPQAEIAGDAENGGEELAAEGR
jgi:hypothetical protein